MMLAELYQCASKFLKDRKGQAAITFGIAAVPLLIAVGSAIDYGRAVTARSALQQATDATALAIAHGYLSITSTSLTLTTPTQTYLTGAMNSPAPSGVTVTYNGVTGTVNAATLNNISLSQNNTELCIKTTMIIPTMVMSIARFTYMTVGANACAQSGQTYEVALVLDNSGSMAELAGGQSKMASLITAASQLVDILIPSGTATPTTAISVTPFTALVNVGPNTAASYLDTLGQSSIHWQNFHRPNGTSWKPTSKFDLFNAMKSQSWGGCVEDRPYPYITTDTAASSSVPDTLFVPFLSPDDPGATTSSSTGYSCYPASGSCGYSVPPYIFYNSYLSDSGSSTTVGNCTAGSAYASADNATGTGSDGVYNQYSGSGMTMVCKYKGSTVSSLNRGTGLLTGPNYLCSSQQLTPLTTSNSSLKTAIGNMVAGGSTNLATGFMWGWRTISPVVNPFPTASILPIGQQNPKSYNGNVPVNNKIIILMTDGFNSWTSNPYSPWQSTYESFGYYVNNRLSNYASGCSGSSTTSSTFRCQMDAVTLEACTRAKAAGITIYTVGFTISSDPIDAQGISLLKSCASDPSKYYQASDGTGIVSAFQQIASAIQNLRLAQ